MNPYEHDETPDPDDTRRLCGCGDPRCWIVLGDETNVIAKNEVYACDCVGLCYFCGQIDSLHRLVRISGSWLSHPDCASNDLAQSGCDQG